MDVSAPEGQELDVCGAVLLVARGAGEPDLPYLDRLCAELERLLDGPATGLPMAPEAGGAMGKLAREYIRRDMLHMGLPWPF